MASSMLKEPTCNGAFSTRSPVGSISLDDFAPFSGCWAELLPDTFSAFQMSYPMDRELHCGYTSTVKLAVFFTP
jgi:hypothetical protein